MIGFRTLLCAASAACGLTLGPSAFAAQVTIDVPGCDSFSFSGNTLSCNTSGGSGASASCSLSPNNPSVPAGTNQTLTMSCSNMGTTSYSWSGCTSSSGNTCQVKLTSPGSAHISVTANDGSNNISKSTDVTFTDPNTGGGDTGGGINIPASCGDGSKTVQGPTINDFSGSPVSVAIGKGQTAVFPVKAPAGGGKVVMSYYRAGNSSDQTAAVAYVSKTACDFSTSSLRDTAVAANQWAFGEAAVNLYGVLDGGSGIETSWTGYTLHMKQGEIWYLMFQNKSRSGRDSCAESSCNVVIKANYQR